MLHNILIYRDRNNNEWKYLTTYKNEEMEDPDGYVEVLSRIEEEIYNEQVLYLVGLENPNHDIDCEQCNGW